MASCHCKNIPKELKEYVKQRVNDDSNLKIGTVIRWPVNKNLAEAKMSFSVDGAKGLRKRYLAGVTFTLGECSFLDPIYVLPSY